MCRRESRPWRWHIRGLYKLPSLIARSRISVHIGSRWLLALAKTILLTFTYQLVNKR
jgi:hypothetical protein